jgi:hypothetical protein
MGCQWGWVIVNGDARVKAGGRAAAGLGLRDQSKRDSLYLGGGDRLG